MPPRRKQHKALFGPDDSKTDALIAVIRDGNAKNLADLAAAKAGGELEGRIIIVSQWILEVLSRPREHPAGLKRVVNSLDTLIFKDTNWSKLVHARGPDDVQNQFAGVLEGIKGKRASIEALFASIAPVELPKKKKEGCED